MQPTFQAIIFDMDGTMVDNMAVHNRIWIEFLTEHGIILNPADFNERTAGRTTPEVLRLFFGADLDDAQIALLGDEKEQRYRAYFRAHARPVSGLHELLAAARLAGLRLGVATAAPPGNVDFLLGCLGLADFFDGVVNGAEVRNGKPDPEIFLKAADRLGVPPEACLVFEDALFGVEAARRAGMQAILLTTTISAHEAQSIPGIRKVIPDFQQPLDTLLA